MTLPQGFRFAGICAGVKPSGNRDVALLVSDTDCSAAGVFTTNMVRAAPVRACQRRLPSNSIRGVVINSGNANACTGEQGEQDAEEMCATLAQTTGCQAEHVLVCSTGVIGRLLPMDKLRSGIKSAASVLEASEDALSDAATAILTTDTRPKVSRKVIEAGGKTAAVVGIAKGAAMIGPNMATMLAFVLTDASVPSELCQQALRQGVDTSFHCISVEGHTSTNDTVLLLANGASGLVVNDGNKNSFLAAVQEVCQELAQAIIEDAEGASHKITIDVTGTRTNEEAKRIAKTVAESALVKTAVYGNDPNWGRICSAAGYAGVDFAESDMSLRVNGTLLYDRGKPTAFDEAQESERMRSQRETLVELIFQLGDGRCRFWTSDLTREYVHLNADYTT